MVWSTSKSKPHNDPDTGLLLSLVVIDCDVKRYSSKITSGSGPNPANWFPISASATGRYHEVK